MIRKTASLSIVASAIIIIILASLAFGQPWRPALLPNPVFGCSTCHFDPNGGGPRNPFGVDWEKIAIPAGDKYTPQLASRDSDGDGVINQVEFDAGTRPGDPRSFPIRGDINNDGQIRSNDAILALRISAALLEPSAYQKWSADMNNDGNIRANDSILILRASAGLGAPVRNNLLRKE
jgi:hypothetical protein